MKKGIRHGDLALIIIDKIPEKITPSETNVIMQGSGGNDHKVKNGIIYFKQNGQFIIGYLHALPKCQLLHPDHGKGNSEIKVSNIHEGYYELRKQFEYTHDAMKPVID
jgi:hypothetical protein